MSADNWTKCPKCIKSNELANSKFERELSESYGKIPSLTWKANFDKLAGMKKGDELKDCLREDYEIGVIEGKFQVSYSGHCTNCDFSFEFNHLVENTELLKESKKKP